MRMTGKQHSSLAASLKYRPDIDGLRAIAVLSVILFHFDFDLFVGGFVGVDIFFVISGYLITKRLLSMHENGGISFKAFYIARIRRLFPALFATLVISFMVGLYILIPSELKRVSISTVTSLTSTANFFFWSEAGYWDASASEKPLLHIWSLSVEEQFYAVWPALVALVLAVGSKRMLFGAFAVCTAASVIATELALRVDPGAAFYMMPFRVAEFGLGAMCVRADGMQWRNGHLWSAVREVFSLAGLALIALAAVSYDGTTRFPGLAAMVPCLGSALIILARQAPISGRLLTSAPAVGIGLISYSLYLVHWPLVIYYKMQTGPHLAAAEQAWLLSVCVLLAYLMYQYIETPFRRPRRAGAEILQERAAGVLLASLTPAILLVLFSLVVQVAEGFPGRFNADIKNIVSKSQHEINDIRYLHQRSICPQQPRVTCGKEDLDRQNALILGDSHGIDALNIMRAAYPEVNFMMSVIGGCPPLHDVQGIFLFEPDCQNLNKTRWYYMDSLKNTNTIVIAMQMHKTRERSMKELFSGLRRKIYNVIVLGAGPYFVQNIRHIVMRHNTLKNIDAFAHSYMRGGDLEIDERMRPFVKNIGGVYITKADFFCPDGVCRIVMPDKRSLLLIDSHHMSYAASVEFARHLRRKRPNLFKSLAENDNQHALPMVR